MTASASSRAAHQPTPTTTPTTTLRALLDQRRAEGQRLTLDEAIAAIVPLCLDLKERHDRGERVYVHPAAIAPGPDGLARIATRLAVVPTNARDRACMAPELQRTLEPGDARASVYSVGACLYEMVTGSVVGPGMRRPREVDPALPESLEVLLSKALVGDPAHRPDDLGALASAMHHLAPMKSIHPPDVDESALDHAGALDVDVKLSMIPPVRSTPPPPSLPPQQYPPSSAQQIPSAPRMPVGMSGDPLGQVVDARRTGPNIAQVLATLKARLEADPRPRYVVNKNRMDHGPFSAVELLQQIASNAFSGDDELRDELSGQAHPIKEWEEFSPFAKHAQMAREIKAEKKEVARVASAEKKAGALKVVIGIVLVVVIAGAFGLWLLKKVGSRNDEIAVEDDEALDLSIDGGIKGHSAGGRGGRRGGGGGGGGNFPAGMSFEAALNSNNQTIDMGSGGGGPDLTNAQLSAPLKNGTFLGACGTPDSMKVTVKVAVKMGRAVGVSVYTNPSNSAIASCIDRHVRGLGWPANPKMDFVTTTY